MEELMNQGNITSINWNANNMLTVFVKDEGLFLFSGEQIGVSLKKYSEVEQALTKCKNRLIELGEIKIPKTPEEIIAEQNEMLTKQNEMLRSMIEQVNNLQNKIGDSSDEHASNTSTSKPSTSRLKGKSRGLDIESSNNGGPVQDTN